MAYFKKFPKVRYIDQDVVNILTSILPKYSPIQDTTLFFYHSLTDGERPEDVSFKYYGTTEHHWLILILNNIIDPYYDWLLTQQELETYVKEKYGSNADGIHHFENLNTGNIVDQYESLQYFDMVSSGTTLPQHIHPVSNFEYEMERNEKKREIKVISPDRIFDIIKQFEQEMSKV